MYIFISIKPRFVGLAGHAVRMEKTRTAYKIMLGNVVGEMRPGRSKPRYRTELNEVEYGSLSDFREHVELLGPIKGKIFSSS
jgi:hypothetical protein